MTIIQGKKKSFVHIFAHCISDTSPKLNSLLFTQWNNNTEAQLCIFSCFLTTHYLMHKWEPEPFLCWIKMHATNVSIKLKYKTVRIRNSVFEEGGKAWHPLSHLCNTIMNRCSQIFSATECRVRPDCLRQGELSICGEHMDVTEKEVGLGPQSCQALESIWKWPVRGHRLSVGGASLPLQPSNILPLSTQA